MRRRKCFVHKQFRDCISLWLDRGKAPDSAIESSWTQFTSTLGYIHAQEFCYDHFKADLLPEPGWSVQQIGFNNYFNKKLSFYLPLKWNYITVQGAEALIGTRELVYQSVQVLNKYELNHYSNDIIDNEEIISFAYMPAEEGLYHQWIFVSWAYTGTFWLYHINGFNGEYAVVQKGDAIDKLSVSKQLLSIVNSSPWKK